MALRIGFDMDGTLADFGRAFHEVEVRLFGPGPGLSPGQPEKQERNEAHGSSRHPPAEHRDPAENRIVNPQQGEGPSPRELRRRRDLVWKAIQSTPNFWSSLKPVDPEAVRRIHALMLRHQWEVFFITQRPSTEGQTVQRQTQQWLVEQGFDLPSALVIGGSRGAAAEALRLNYHVDDSPQNCLDVISESGAKPILIVSDDDKTTITSARKLGIGTAMSIGEGLDILESATLARSKPSVLARLAQMVGWK